MSNFIYLDHSASTPLRSEVMDAMQPFWADHFGNPSSIHRAGRKAHAGLDQARRTIAGILGAKESEIIFNSCGTEGANAALRGIALARRKTTGANRIITQPTEHKAVLYTALDLAENYGFEVTLLPVDDVGRVDVTTLDTALGDGSDVNVVSIMLANNEVGTVQPIAQIGALCRERGVPFHTDAVQAAGKLSLDVASLNVDALSVSAHKFYGPKGTGFLYLRQGTPFQAVQTGAGHESDRRAGTENVPLIVGMAAAFALVEAERESECARLRVLRDRLIGGVLEKVEGAQLTGAATQRLDNHASFVIKGVEAEGILIGLDLAGIAASSGSACTNASQRPSHVLEALGIPPLLAAGGLRLSLGHSSTPAQMETLLVELPRIVQRIRGAQPAQS